MKVKVTVPGLKQLGADYANASAVQLPTAVREGLREVAERIAEEARAKSPHRTGAFAASIKQPSPSGALGFRVKGGPVSNPRSKSRRSYFGAVNFGTGPRPGHRGPHNIAKHEVMYSTLEAHRADVTAAGRKALDDLIEKLS